MRIWQSVVALLALNGTVQAQMIELERPTSPPSAATEVVGGEKATPSKWPATFLFVSATGSRCTATAVGPRVILTAAHCLPELTPEAIAGGIKNSTVKLWCTKPDKANFGHDIALCATSSPIPIASDKPYESVDVGLPPAKGAPLTILGFGCIKVGGTGGVLYQGVSAVGQPATEKRQFLSSGKVALCAGDSGGASYLPIGEGRKIVGVASDVIDGVSRFTLMAHPYIRNFVVTWQQQQRDPTAGTPVEVRICGIDGSNSYCLN